MALHYHVTPITPNEHLLRLAGRCFMVCYRRPDQLAMVQQIAASIAYDNGAYPAFTVAMEKFETARAAGADVSLDDFLDVARDWSDYYAWVDPLLDSPTSWAIVPDVIGAGAQEQDALLLQWPHGRERGAPVWHTDEPIDRLLHLLDQWPRVCIGSTGEHWRIWKPGREGVDLEPAWESRMVQVWDAIAARHRRTPYVHMLRGMALLGHRWPFASADSSNIGQNAHRYGGPERLAQRLDATNPPAAWKPRRKHLRHPDLFVGSSA